MRYPVKDNNAFNVNAFIFLQRNTLQTSSQLISI